MNFKKITFSIIGGAIVLIFLLYGYNSFAYGNYRVDGTWVNTSGYSIVLNRPFSGGATYDINGSNHQGSFNIIDDKIYISINGYRRMVADLPKGNITRLNFRVDPSSEAGKTLPEGYYALDN